MFATSATLHHMAPRSKKQSRLGRPPASDSAETQQRIIVVARTCFGEMGFGATTNAHIAAKAGITAGGLYHYFDSKSALFAATYEESERLIYTQFEAALVGAQTFIDRLKTILEIAHQLNREDPSLARFIGAARVDLSRHDELRLAVGAPGIYGTGFFNRLIDNGVVSGEIPPEHRDMVSAFVRTLVVGLTDAVSHDDHSHRLAIDAIGAALEGRLLEVKRRRSR
jgi:AcrR family transcriptional regulator